MHLVFFFYSHITPHSPSSIAGSPYDSGTQGKANYKTLQGKHTRKPCRSTRKQARKTCLTQHRTTHDLNKQRNPPPGHHTPPDLPPHAHTAITPYHLAHPNYPNTSPLQANTSDNQTPDEDPNQGPPHRGGTDHRPCPVSASILLSHPYSSVSEYNGLQPAYLI